MEWYYGYVTAPYHNTPSIRSFKHISVYYRYFTVTANFNRNKTHSEADMKLFFCFFFDCVEPCPPPLIPCLAGQAPDNSFLVFTSTPTVHAALAQPASKNPWSALCQNPLCITELINQPAASLVYQ